MSMILLIRHGQASFGQHNYDKLSPLGIEQARILGSHLQGIGLEPDAIYSGAMSRQLDTAAGVAACYREKGVVLPEPVVLSGLNEFDSASIVLSQIQDMQKNEPSLVQDLVNMYQDRGAFKRVFEGAMLRWVSGRFDREGPETWAGFVLRVFDALKAIMEDRKRGRTVFVFTSGGPIAASLQSVLSISPEAAIRLNWQIVNTSYTKLMYNDERITLAGFNCITHLELDRERSRLISYR